MPIQFRCPSCDRMLGISRRKAGSTVNCPRCAAEVRVPALAGMAIESVGPSAGGAMPVIAPVAGSGRKVKRSPGEPPPLELENLPLFERPDFESLLAPPTKPAEPPPPRPQARPPEAIRQTAPIPSLTPTVTTVSLPADDVDMVSGLFVTRLWLTVAAVGAAVLIGLAFGAGYWLASVTVAKGA